MESEMTDSFKSYSYLKQVFANNGLKYKVIRGYDKKKYSKYGILIVEVFVKGKGRPRIKLLN